jgi:energy-coupling factor transport system substrate-specific component
MTPRELALIPVCVALNAAVGVVASQAGLPVYLDTLGTILAVALAGPRAGALTGLASQVLAALTVGAFMLFFIPIQLVVVAGVTAALATGGFRGWIRTLLWGALTGLVGGALSAIISYVVFKGVTATGVTAVTTALRAAGAPLELAVAGASIGTDVLDKVAVFALAGVALRGLPLRLRHRFAWVQRGLAA